MSGIKIVPSKNMEKTSWTSWNIYSRKFVVRVADRPNWWGANSIAQE